MMFVLSSRARPILKWAGGKSSVLDQLINYFPSHFKRYIEPFLGGGAVFFALQSECPSLVNDCNDEIMNVYQIVRDHPDELMFALDRLSEKYSEVFYYELRSNNPTTSIDIAARTIFLNKCGFNGLYRQNSKGDFNVPYGHRERCPALYKQKDLFQVSEHLKNGSLSSGDFEVVIDQAKEGDFIYCDPPYHPLSSTSSFTAYHSNGFSEAEQRRLEKAAKRAIERGAIVAISNSTSPIVLDLYQEWRIEKIVARRAINSVGTKRGEIQEILAILPKEEQ